MNNNKHNFLFVIVALLLLCFCESIFAREHVRLAVLDFDNICGKTEYEHFRKGIREWLQSSINIGDDIELLERGKITDLLKEIDLSNSGLFDKRTAIKAGMLLSASHVIVGSFSCLNRQWSLNVRCVQVESGAVLANYNENCTDDDLLRKISLLAGNIQSRLTSNVTSNNNNELNKDAIASMVNRLIGNENIETFEKFSTALDKQENGDEQAMRDYLKDLEREDILAMAELYFWGRGCKKNYEKAFDLYLKAADQGVVEASMYVGYCYKQGLGTSVNLGKAIEWFRKGAEQGDASAQNQLGYCYEEGTGVPPNYYIAASWYKKAAEQGSDDAQNNLGLCYFKGKGMAKDYKLAEKWLKKAAMQGDKTPQHNLGTFYYAIGKYDEAIVWLRKAANQSYPDAWCNLGTCYAKGAGVEQNYEKAIECYTKAMDLGVDTVIINNLGQVYYDTGKYETALYYFRNAAEKGDRHAQYDLAKCYYLGKGVSRNYGEAVKWLRKSVDCDNPEPRALFLLGVCYEEGYGIAKNIREAVRLLTIAADNDHDMAQYHLGLLYFNGDEIKQDYKLANQWFRKAAELGNAPAQYCLGANYLYGKGVKKNKAEAIKWLRKAAKQGNKSAQSLLGQAGNK